MSLIARVRDQSRSMSLWEWESSWQVTKTGVAGNCAAMNLISFSYNFLCFPLQLNFSILILCVSKITLQWNNKNALKRPSQMWLWKGYMTSSKETVSFKRIQVEDCIQSYFSRYEILLIWRKNTQNNSKSVKWIQKQKTFMNFWGWILKIFTITNILSLQSNWLCPPGLIPPRN